MKYIKRQTTDNLNIDWKNFYRNVFALVIPMAIQNLINVGVTATDVFMLGRVGEKVLSGASLAGQIQFIMMLIFFGITAGATVLTAQYWGKRDTDTIEKILGMGLTAGIVVAGVFTVFALVIPETLMHIFTSDKEVIIEGAKYLRIVGLSYIFMAVTQVYLNIMRSIERVVVATVVYFVSLIVNICINAVLIFGLFGAPRLEIIGAAIGTLCARISETALVFLYAKFKNALVKIRIRYLVQIDRVLFADALRYSMPVVVNEFLWGLGVSCNAAVIGHLGSEAVAANSVAQVARQLAQVVVFGVSNATAIWLGKTLGEGRKEHAKAYANRFVMLSLLLGTLGGSLILIGGPIVSSMLTLSEKSQEYLGFMFFVMSYFVIGQAFNTTVICGVFRSGGDVRFGFIADVVTMWGGSILLGAAAAFVFHASVPVVYAILMSDELVKVPICIWWYRKQKWLNNVTREKAELEG